MERDEPEFDLATGQRRYFFGVPVSDREWARLCSDEAEDATWD